MRIAINTRLLIKNKLEGIGWFTYETLKRIVVNHPEHEYIFLFDRKPHPDFIFSNSVKPIVLRPQARHPFLWYIWFQYSVSHFLRKNKVDLFISPDGFIPTRCKTPTLNVIHDINFHHYPKGLPLLTRAYYQHFFPIFARKATQIVTVSHYSKNDLINSYGIEPDKVSVVHNGAN
ncbi:MAG: glycosyltransferase, partial [Bacteroidales bacterium]|nr:glycosyltransferase [Bacteroidales bacterium]